MPYCNKSLFYIFFSQYYPKGGNTMEFLTDGIMALTWQQLVMYAVGITLIWLAIKKGFEPALLLPMGFGAILVNLPFS